MSMSPNAMIAKPNQNQLQQQKGEEKKTGSNLLKTFQHCNNPHLLKLLNRLKNYYQEIEQYESKGIGIKHKDFKQTLFKSLEDILFQISAIETPERRDARLLELHHWFNKKYSYFITMANITDITSPNSMQKYTEHELGLFKEDMGKEEENYADHHSILHEFEKPKEILKKYIVKQVNNINLKVSSNVINDDTNANAKTKYAQVSEKLRMSGTFGNRTFRSVDMRSTLNSTARSKRFLPAMDSKLNTLIDPLHETKFSYSFYRPQYSFLQLGIESSIIKAKNKALADKRAQDDLNAAVNDFGFAKASMNKTQLHKFDLKNLILEYKKKDHELENGKEKHHENEQLKQEQEQHQHQHQPSKIEKERILNEKPVTKILHHVSSMRVQSKSNNAFNLNKKESKSYLLNKKKTTAIIKRKSVDIDALINTEQHIRKITMNNIMNVCSNGLLEPSKTIEVVFNIRLRVDSMKVFKDNYERIKKDNKEMPNEALCRKIQSDEIPMRRLLSETMMNVKQIDNHKDGYSRHYQPLSRFDMIHSSSFVEKRSKGHFKFKGDQTPRTACGYSEILYDDNHLRMRQTLDSFKPCEVNLLCTSLKYNDSQWSKSSIKNAFMSPEKEVVYPLSYFPRSGSSLLKIPKSLLKDKTKKKKKREKK